MPGPTTIIPVSIFYQVIIPDRSNIRPGQQLSSCTSLDIKKVKAQCAHSLPEFEGIFVESRFLKLPGDIPIMVLKARLKAVSSLYPHALAI